MNERIKSIMDNCASDDLGQCLHTLDSLPDPSSLSAQEKVDLAAGLSSLFYKEETTDEQLTKLLHRTQRAMSSLGPEIISYVLEQLEDSDSETAESYSRVLGDMGSPAVAPLLEAIPKASTSYARINYLMAVGFFSDPSIIQAIPALIEYSNAEDRMIKSQAIYSIGRLANRISADSIHSGEKNALFDAVFKALSDSKPIVRQQAAKTLGKLKLNHYLSTEQEEKAEKAYRAILGMDNFDWDPAFIVRRAAETGLKYFRQEAQAMHSNPHTQNTNSRYYQDFKVVDRRELAPGTVHFKVNAPLVARKIEAGQFVILRPNENSERIPLSICGWNREEGYIELIIMAAGRTSTEAVNKKIGDRFHDLVGPLGQRSHVHKVDGTAVVLGGGFGAGAIIPTARDLKSQGNKVIGIIGARSRDLLLMEKELGEVCDEVIVTTNDGSAGVEGFVTTALEQIMEREKVGFTLAIGPVPMMKAVADMTDGKGIECYVSLNAIMVDGTGMCGACRVTVDGKTRFACFHGPDFDGHKVNFEELTKRLKMFSELEHVAMEAIN